MHPSKFCWWNELLEQHINRASWTREGESLEEIDTSTGHAQYFQIKYVKHSKYVLTTQSIKCAPSCLKVKQVMGEQVCQLHRDDSLTDGSATANTASQLKLVTWLDQSSYATLSLHFQYSAGHDVETSALHNLKKNPVKSSHCARKQFRWSI
jgi:hypothetical protein